MKIAERLRACVNAAPSNGNVVLTWQTADRLAKALADMDAEQENTRTLDPSIESLQAELERLREALRPFASHVGKFGEVVTLSIGKDTWTGTLTTDDFERARDTLASLKQYK